VEEAQGHYAQAVELCARVIDQFEASPSSKANMGRSRFLMARALRGAKREEEAQIQAQLALELVQDEDSGLAQQITMWLEPAPHLRAPADR
jgi:hypothetical protein